MHFPPISLTLRLEWLTRLYKPLLMCKMCIKFQKGILIYDLSGISRFYIYWFSYKHFFVLNNIIAVYIYNDLIPPNFVHHGKNSTSRKF